MLDGDGARRMATVVVLVSAVALPLVAVPAAVVLVIFGPAACGHGGGGGAECGPSRDDGTMGNVRGAGTRGRDLHREHDARSVGRNGVACSWAGAR